MIHISRHFVTSGIGSSQYVVSFGECWGLEHSVTMGNPQLGCAFWERQPAIAMKQILVEGGEFFHKHCNLYFLLVGSLIIFPDLG